MSRRTACLVDVRGLPGVDGAGHPTPGLEPDLNRLGEDLVGVVRETMQPSHVPLWLRSDSPPRGEQAD